MPQLFMNREFWVLKTEYDLLYLLIHGSTHRWQRLKWLVDINDFLLHISFDRQAFLTLARSYKAERLPALYNRIALLYLPDPQLIDVKVNVPGFMVKCCIREIKSKDVAWIPRSLGEAITTSYFYYRYIFLLYPDTHRRIKIFEKSLVNAYDSEKINTTNIFLLILYRPFSYLYRHISGVQRKK